MSILSESSFERAKHCNMNIEFDLLRVGVIIYGGRQGPNTAAGMETIQIYKQKHKSLNSSFACIFLVCIRFVLHHLMI